MLATHSDASTTGSASIAPACEYVETGWSILVRWILFRHLMGNTSSCCPIPQRFTDLENRLCEHEPMVRVGSVLLKAASDDKHWILARAKVGNHCQGFGSAEREAEWTAA